MLQKHKKEARSHSPYAYSFLVEISDEMRDFRRRHCIKSYLKGTQTDNRIASHFQCEISATRLYCCCGCH